MSTKNASRFVNYLNGWYNNYRKMHVKYIEKRFYMDFLLDIIIDLVLEEGVEASQNVKIPKGIRYFILAFAILVYAAIIGIAVWFGINMLKENIVVGVGILIFAVIFFVLCIIKFVSAYKRKKKNNSNHKE